MQLHRLATLAIVSAVLVACGGGSDTPPAAVSYEYFSVGEPKAEVQTLTPTEPSVAIMGGGPDVDSAFRWMIERSGIRPGTGGRFVIIRASGSDGYNPYIYYGSEQNSSGCAGGILSAGTSAQNGARGIGVGVEAALLVQGDGKRTPYTGQRATNPSTTTDSAIYFVRPLQAATICAPGKPLTAPGMEVRKLADGSLFNLSDWSGAPAYTIDINAGVLSRDPY